MSLSVNQAQFEDIKDLLLKDRDSFDKEIYNLIKHDKNIMKIKLPGLSREERYILHTFSRTNVYIYSVDSGCDTSEVVILMNRRHITQITKKYKSAQDLIDNLRTEIDEVLDKNINLFLGALKIN